MKRKLFPVVVVALLFGFGSLCDSAHGQDFEAGKIYISVKKEYASWDCPLHTELIVNGETVNIYTADTFEPIEQYIKPGWNDFTIKTKAQEPAASGNSLIFQIGPMYQDPADSSRYLMNPVIWEFRNGTDWKLENGLYSHPLGPDVKEVTLSYRLYWAGLEHENTELKAGDYVLSAKSQYASWNTPVTATVTINGTTLNSFVLSERQIVITSLLKPGKNEVKLESTRVKDSIAGNDVECSIGGPAEWFADRNQFMVTPITEFKAMQGWTKEAQTGQLTNVADPAATTIVRTIEFMKK